MINLSSYQKAIYEELVKLGYSVYDEVPEDAKFPYIVIGDIDFSEGQNNFNDLLDINLRVFIKLRIFSLPTTSIPIVGSSKKTILGE